VRAYHVHSARGPIRLAREGPTLVILNASTLTDPSHTRDTGAGVAGSFANATDVLVGFDRSPALGGYDGIAPAYAATTLEIPAGVREVLLEIPGPGNVGSLNSSLNHAQLTAQADLLVDWSSCPTPSSIVPLAGLLPNSTSGNKLGHFLDLFGGLYPPKLETPVLDQAIRTLKPTWLRPHLATSGLDPIHVVTVANTLFSMLGPSNFLRGSATGSKVVKRIYVSVSVATLVVIGTAALTVGSPGAGEVFRGLIPAGIATLIDFGESGLEVDIDGTTGTNGWQAYTAGAVTFDASVLGG
jgi:hypothetical protein